MTRDIREVVRDEPLMRDRLLALLAGGPRTVRELAADAGLPAAEVMVWVMGMRKYGYVVEEKASGRAVEYRYAAVERA
jgi:predicted Rossmann fold nucleotide-binding protein DprA/Smf involved in DNA uptake